MRAVNLIPSEQRRGAGGATGRSDGIAYVIVGLLAGIVALVAAWALAHHQIGDRTSKIASANARTSALQAEASALESYTSFQTLSQQRQQAVLQIAAQRFDWAHAMHEIGRVLPSDVDLTSFQGTTPGAGSTGSTSAAGASGPALVIQGCTTSQAEVAQTMARLRLMDGVGDVAVSSSAHSGSNGSGASGTSCPHPVNFSMTVSYAQGTATPGSGATTATAASTTTTGASK